MPLVQVKGGLAEHLSYCSFLLFRFLDNTSTRNEIVNVQFSLDFCYAIRVCRSASVQMVLNYAAKQKRRGSQTKMSSGESVRAYTKRILAIQPMKPQCISILLSDTHLNECFANITSDSHWMKPSP